ncbi:MAG: outer membrane protein assembly factor BamA [Rhodospirillaceae bacterium]
MFELKITKIEVQGAKRIEEETIRTYSGLKSGDVISAPKLDSALKSLFGTGLFADVSIEQAGSKIIVKVVENPVINRIEFEGNRQLDETSLRPELQLKPRIVYTRTKIQEDVERLINIYRRSGRFGVSIQPKVIKLSQNRVDLVFEIEEGELTKIRRIFFVGNRVYSSSDLRSVIQTKESAWYRFLTSDDNYDPDRLSYDRGLLRKFYIDKGYADFQIRSAIAELAPDKKSFFITFILDEGKRYKFGKILINSSIKGLLKDRLKQNLPISSGDVYSSALVDKSLTVLADLIKESGFAFVEVRPEIQRLSDSRVIDLTFNIIEGKKAYVERIEISGNTRTIDPVIRREVPLVEGDAFNINSLKSARRNIRGLGFFKSVDLQTKSGSSPDKTRVDIKVQEQSTGELSLGAGYSSSDGPIADVGIRERNLLGLGKDLSLNFRAGGESSQIDLKFTEPYFLDRKLSAGFDIFRTVKELGDASSFDRKSTGGALRIGYYLSDQLIQRWRYNLSFDDVTSVPASASLAVQQQKGRSSVSSISETLIYDTRDDKRAARNGLLASHSVSLAGLGGSVKYLKTEVDVTKFYPLTEKITGNLSGGGGVLLPFDGEARIIDRFFLGGRSLRGFQNYGVSPRDRASRDALGGEWFYNGSAQLEFPIGLPNEFDVKGKVFTDFGSVGKTDKNISVVDDHSSLRASAGFGISWMSPVGPFTIDFAKAFLKEDFDKTETIRFDFGTRF